MLYTAFTNLKSTAVLKKKPAAEPQDPRNDAMTRRLHAATLNIAPFLLASF